MALFELLATWQALVVAAVCVGVTHLVKVVVDLRIGMERRKKNVVLNRLVFPGIPVVTGALVAVFVPLHPEAIELYVQKFESFWESRPVLAIWGGVIGMFADYFFSKLKALTTDMKQKPSDE